MAEAEENATYDSFKAAARAFIQSRLQAKLDKVSDEDPKRQELLAQHEPAVWLEDAARRVQQIQAVTHSLKPIHPDARGTNLYVEPAQQPPLAELGSHALGADFAGDVVGNAAALDVYKFLKLQVGGQSLLSALLANDVAALQALHDDPVQAKVLRDAFVSLTEPRAGGPSSHGRAKQMYWLAGNDATDDGQYELLAPLYATSLAHAVYGEIQEHRFGEANKAARTARRERKAHDGVFHDYPGLAAQKMGGTKPQNISQLNSERGGVNYLLSSLPPAWTPSAVRLPVHAESVFDRMFIARPEVHRTVRALRKFLAEADAQNKATRDTRKAYTDALLDELVAFANELQQLVQPGWSKDDERFQGLNYMQKLWLDPLRAELPEEARFASDWLYMDWPAEVGKSFGAWLNKALGEQFGDVEAREWRKELLTDEDGFKQQLRDLRDKLDGLNGGAA
ncbi:type I-F CRISPR-associated protein Csy1 [Comamonas fluminis]|uniref:type I-F CRISPR-associated protein Csy1 n=1 Tax=Comamonas fluminis TaxID=2796366 RepID=UPI001C469DFF|nr:type I-F CRISPR-associated protein Csy1 [Comamonas fluminis]